MDKTENNKYIYQPNSGKLGIYKNYSTRHRHQQFDNLVLGTFSSSNEKLVSAKLWTTREINTGHTLDNFVAITCLKLEC